MNTNLERACPICTHSGRSYLFSVRNFKIVKCGKCSLVGTLGEVKTDYKSYHRDQEYQKFKKLFENIFLNRVRTICKFQNTPGRALEIGCSTGVLLNLLKNRNWEVWGVEPSESALVAEKKGIRVINKFFQEADLPRGYFDVVILNHTLEHLENPVSILVKARSLLRRRGIIYIDVPNFASLSAKLLGRRWPYIMPEEHIWYFTPVTLKKLIRKSGFKPIYIHTQSGIFDYGNPLAGIIDKLIMGRKSFFLDFVTAPFAFINTLIGMGTSLTVVGKK